MPIGDHQVHRGRDDVDVVGLDPHTVQCLEDRQLRRAGEQGGEDALVRGGQVLDEDERCTGVQRQVLQQQAESFEATRGSSDSDDGKGVLGGGVEEGVRFRLDSRRCATLSGSSSP